MATASPSTRPTRYYRNSHPCLLTVISTAVCVAHSLSVVYIQSARLYVYCVYTRVAAPMWLHQSVVCISSTASMCIVQCTYISPCVCVPPPLQELSVPDDPKDFNGSKTSGQSPNAGWYNRFVQTGKSGHETKTSGCLEDDCNQCPIAHIHPSHV